jgi:hypothetical protein
MAVYTVRLAVLAEADDEGRAGRFDDVAREEPVDDAEVAAGNPCEGGICPGVGDVYRVQV